MKLISKLSAVFALTIALAGCANQKPAEEVAKSNDAADTAQTELTKVKDLKIQFVPSRDPETITTQTEPLKELLQKQMKEEGYDIENVDISVGTNYEATGEALSAGTIDVGFIPGGTYVLYDDGAEVILTATRDGLSVDSDDPKEWNDNKPTTLDPNNQVTFYRGEIVAGPSEKGKALQEKVNSGEKLTWEDLNDANWAVMNSSSSSGYIYPSMWLDKEYKKTVSDLAHAAQSDSYASSYARLASGQVDILVAYADARVDYEKQWQEEWGRKESIWDETAMIALTDKIYNDTISVSKNSKVIDDKMKEALTNAFIKIGETEEGKKVISIYSHTGYKKAQDSDYDNERKAQEFLKEINKK